MIVCRKCNKEIKIDGENCIIHRCLDTVNHVGYREREGR